MWVFIHDCDWCEASEERLFTDNWTGMELCLSCLHRVAYYVTNSPGSEGDNLDIELMTRVGDRRQISWDDEEEDNDPTGSSLLYMFEQDEEDAWTPTS